MKNGGGPIRGLGVSFLEGTTKKSDEKRLKIRTDALGMSRSTEKREKSRQSLDFNCEPLIVTVFLKTVRKLRLFHFSTIIINKIFDSYIYMNFNRITVYTYYIKTIRN